MALKAYSPSLKKSEMNEIEQIQEVLEFVQVEIAKQEISAPIQKKSINSHNDVSHLAQEMRCPLRTLWRFLKAVAIGKT